MHIIGRKIARTKQVSWTFLGKKISVISLFVSLQLNSNSYCEITSSMHVCMNVFN
jgi:hypothetical protein